MAIAILVFLLAAGVGLVAAAQRVGAHAELLELLGGFMLAAGLVGLGFELARPAG